MANLDTKTIAMKLIQMGHSPNDVISTLETASKLGMLPKEITPAEKIANQKIEADAIETKNQNELKATQLQTKATDLGNAKNDEYLNTAVGINPIGRISFSSLWNGGKKDFLATVKQLTDQETMGTLLALKQAGGTLGALSDSERQMLQDAATKINNWAIKDDKGNITGYDASEDDFKAELNKLQTLAQTAADKAKGSIPNTQATPTNNGQSQASFDGLQQWIQSNPNNPKAQKAAEMIKSGQLTAETFGGMVGGGNKPNSAPVIDNNKDPLGLGI
jgi:hypothetical protein